jgi:hypothetical protein
MASCLLVARTSATCSPCHDDDLGVPKAIMIRGDMCRRWVKRAEDEDDVRISDTAGVSLDQIEIDGCVLHHWSSMPRRRTYARPEPSTRRSLGQRSMRSHGAPWHSCATCQEATSDRTKRCQPTHSHAPRRSQRPARRLTMSDATWPTLGIRGETKLASWQPSRAAASTQ